MKAVYYIGDRVWCSTCRRVKPILETVCAKYNIAPRMYDINDDDADDVVSKYGVRSVPTIIVINGQMIDRIVGACTQREIEDAIKDVKLI